MQRPKSILLLLIIVSIMIVTFVVVGKLSSPRELPEQDSIKEDDTEEEYGDLESSLDMNIVPGEGDNGFIAVPKIPLDRDTDEHLQLFRDKVRSLTAKYPKTFSTLGTTREKVVALTFDDGPDDITTPEVADILDNYDIPGTFFFIGENIEKYSHICHRVFRSGHQIANHSLSHMRPTELSLDAMLDEFQGCSALIEDFKNSNIEYIRPPYGLVTSEQLALLERKNFKVIGWSIDSMDWYTDDPDKIVESVIDSIHPGAIVLMHSAGGSRSRQATLEALPTIIEALRAKGYSFVTVDTLLGYGKSP